jgi:small subunit ribosomal protein S18
MSEEETPVSEAPKEAPAREASSAPPSPARDERPRGRSDDRSSRSRGTWSVKARLRAAARRKARKSKKKGMFQRRKVCRFCADKNLAIDYKEAKTLRLFISETGKMTPRRISGTCAKHQRKLAVAIKRGRQIALLPFASNHV